MTEKSLDDGNMLSTLLKEMLQTERSAFEHTRKEASRLDGDAPASSLLAVADHAERALPELRRVAHEESSIGETLGKLFSVLREGVADKMISEEKSYRGTMLGLHHGIGCAILTRAVAGTILRIDVVELLDRWLDERRPLVERCEHQIPWFATHVEKGAS